MFDTKKNFARKANAARTSCPLVFAADEAYTMQLATTMRSVVETNASSWPIEFHVLTDSIAEDTRRKILDSLPNGSASIRWSLVDLNLFKGFSFMNYISKMTYARLLIPRVLPDTVSRVLYLDADLLVMDSLEPLWETDLDGAIMGAVVDLIDPALKRGEPRCEGLPRVRDYFNAGVLLIDLDQWREKRVSEKALEYLERHPRSPYSDQDALNFACDKLWKKLDPRWNFQDHVNHVNQRFSDFRPDEQPWIVHYVTYRKPWYAGIRAFNASSYDAFRSRTLFARTPWEKLLDALRRWVPFTDALPRYKLLRAMWRRLRYQKR
jgi:lipopolysaccharide biosynthesis glycosyltransferase